MSKKKRKNIDSVALRREIEALKAQLKEHGVEPTPIKSEAKETSSFDYRKISKTSTRAQIREQPIDLQKLGKASYLKKDILRTTLISVFIISSVIIIKILKLF
ncbi:hypothetical protein A2X44_03685 [candidate division CPR3 bacterium GWF2_35_18]|uniref:Uncharacterized protein n=1 Tax=candidate division CPR3 bacterium GW2011_GWF2_35_18 TaxID=1618350 RepID=A0A0G0E322_UNCC3|nr:MAG: hypothetical protein UR67_C0004G0027 [candidate division CPR3 bacterium GW2011_GWF2_35_18]KKP87067.1 MAG: hypothetical protein UR87_C0005G0006 [candidate division CPR3 bacterium GW2011_GWE2_35_7]OGB63114.1 MAG: hypothetical protein A2X44_03685 [candidate division CPR3 bacterium GWF2_35_18]OGB64072.1 MAG: hypothetical protein A2250_04705 [candidate division CPR3 bacterium RIFOXYA2_FULL_35_13]OGB80610.1 MAG: hypothetical protein A2011_03435 [candidate division CPR3 bacterium GWE2_35_7]